MAASLIVRWGGGICLPGGRRSPLLLDKSETLQLVMLLPADVTPSQRALHVV